MIGLAHGVKVFICTDPADMRRSFDGLCGMTENLMKLDPLTNTPRRCWANLNSGLKNKHSCPKV